MAQQDYPMTNNVRIRTDHGDYASTVKMIQKEQDQKKQEVKK